MSNFDRITDDFFKNYQDRGMKKWAGYYLSDHTQKLEKDKSTRHHHVTKRPEQTAEEISAELMLAFGNHYPVNVQLKELNQEGDLADEIEGFVSGYFESEIIIGNERIYLADISSVVLIESK